MLSEDRKLFIEIRKSALDTEAKSLMAKLIGMQTDNTLAMQKDEYIQYHGEDFYSISVQLEGIQRELDGYAEEVLNG